MANAIKLPSFILPVNFMAKLATTAISLTIIDAKNGIMQNDTAGHTYSTQYAKYKANSMRRFTRDVQQRTKETQFGSGLFEVKTKAGRRQGKQIASNISTRSKITGNTGKLAGYEGRSTNPDVSKVNLRLTGDMLNSMNHKAEINIARVYFLGAEQGQKVLGNQKLGYDILGLNKKNQAEIKRMIVEKLEAMKPRGNYTFKIGY